MARAGCNGGNAVREMAATVEPKARPSQTHAARAQRAATSVVAYSLVISRRAKNQVIATIPVGTGPSAITIVGGLANCAGAPPPTAITSGQLCLGIPPRLAIDKLRATTEH